MFTGHVQHTLDEKGRLSIPAKFREVLNGTPSQSLVMTTAGHPCLVAYPRHEWDLIRKRARDLALAEDAHHHIDEDFLRRFYAEASECALDRQGRILIPPTLREYAQLHGEAIVVGIDYKFEIWSPSAWQEQYQAVRGNTDVIRKTRLRLGM